jgi:hypothetical protein
VFLIINTFIATPRLALIGVAVMVAGLPFYWWWSRALDAATPTSPRGGPGGAAAS